MERLYYVNNAISADAIVTDIVNTSPPALRLSQTIFHPKGGGQRDDAGTIDGIQVLQVIKGDGDAVLHVIADLSSFKIGQCVKLHIDPLRRKLGSALHTTGHLIAAIIERIEPSLHPEQGHHWPGEARVEFSGEPGQLETLQQRLEQELPIAIAADLPVSITYCPPAPREVKIGNFAPIPCGGTHLESLGSVQQVIIRSLKCKGRKTRIGYDVVLRDSFSEQGEPVDGAYAD